MTLSKRVVPGGRAQGSHDLRALLVIKLHLVKAEALRDGAIVLFVCLSVCLSVRCRLFYPKAVLGSAGGGFLYRLQYTC